MAKHRLQGPPWFCLNPEDLIDNVDELGFEELPPLLPCFSVPSLQDKPQNPIVERLNTREKEKGRTRLENCYLLNSMVSWQI